MPLDALDGVIDGKQEAFRVQLDGLAPGEHIVVIRAYDSSNNVGLTKVVLRIIRSRSGFAGSGCQFQLRIRDRLRH